VPLKKTTSPSLPLRLAAGAAAAALLCACTSAKTSLAEPAAAAPAAAAQLAAAPTAAVPSGPANAPVARAGKPGAVALGAGQRAALHAAVAKAPPGLRARLRYALANGDDGKPHLVVYDGQGLGPDGRHPGKPHEYVVFEVLNGAPGEHYDPQQNSVIAPIPPPPERQSAVAR
jgi:hypothetical protein